MQRTQISQSTIATDGLNGLLIKHPLKPSLFRGIHNFEAAHSKSIVFLFLLREFINL